MQLLFDSFIQRFPQELRNRLKTAVAHQTHLNPVERLHAGTCLVLKEQLAEIQELRELQTKKIDIASSKNPFNIFKKTRMKKRIQLQIKNKLILAKENAFQLASLSGYLIPLMRATKDYLTLLKQIEHPYVQLLYTYFASGGANNQETRRDFIDAIVSERALQEIYLPAFGKAITEGGALSIMTAYNKLNGQFCSANEYLIDDVLLKQFDFKGLSMSDWGGVHSTKEVLLHGVDIEMGTELADGTRENPDYNNFFLANPLIKLVKENPQYEKYVNRKVRSILRVMFAIHKFDSKRPKGERNTKEHHALVRKVAEEGIVLLKNEGNLLPLGNNVKTIAVIGDNAVNKHADKGGSSQVKAQYEVTPLEAIKKQFGDKCRIIYAQGYKPNEDGKTFSELAKEALNAAQQADVVIYIGGWIHNLPGQDWGKYRYDAEGKDKVSYEFPFEQAELMNRLSAIKPTVAVLFGGSFAQYDKWVDNCKSILFVGYPGMEGGTAIAEILIGKVNPSGRLSVSFAKKLEDYPAHKMGEFPGNEESVSYKDDIWVGYRYLDLNKQDLLFSFGHGLSYTTFKYSDIKMNNKEFESTEPVHFSVDVTNTGDMDGAEVVQIYVSQKNSKVKRPVKELKGFEKVFLKKGETKTVSFILNKDAFSYWGSESKSWVVDPGEFEILVGSSSEDIRKSISVMLK